MILNPLKMANKHVNAVVIGAGAGGGVVAKELATGGLTVVLFDVADGIPMKNMGMMN